MSTGVPIRLGGGAHAPSRELAAPPWAPGPLRPTLAPCAVHIWRADLDADGEALVELLSGHEQERAARMTEDRERRRWSRSRGLLRALLGSYLQMDAKKLAFVAGPHGKPALAEQERRPGLSFNLAHSGDLALYAFTATGEVGVDLEVARPPSRRRSIDESTIARRVFGSDQARRLERLEPRQREAQFLRLWTLHEAELKRLGTGLGALRTRPPEHPWWVQLDVGPKIPGAASLSSRPRELRCWSWPTPRRS